jgi:predicted  nucleic acid-binding Zn-ribbon protein
MKGRRDREYDRLLTAVHGQGSLVVAEDPADIGPVLNDVYGILDVDAEKERLRKTLEDTKAELRDAKAELDVIRPQAIALSQKVLTLHKSVKDIAKENERLQLAVKKPDYSAAAVETAKDRARQAEARQRTAELRAAELDGHARASEARAAKAEAAIEHAQQHARDAEAAMEDAMDRAEKAFDEGYKDGKSIAQYAMLAAKQMLAAKRAGRIKAMSDDPTDDFAYTIHKALDIEDRVRKGLGIPEPSLSRAMQYTKRKDGE